VGKAHGGATVRTGAEDGEGKMGKGKAMNEAEQIRNAELTAATLREIILAAHSDACDKNPLLAVALGDLIADATRIKNRLNMIASALE
jgi:hypothetical protein